MALIPLSDARDQLNLPAQDDDLVGRLIAAAERHIENATGKVFATETREFRFDGFADRLELPVSPVTSIASITYIERNGAEQTLDPAAYVARPLGTDMAATMIYRAPGATWPCTDRCRGASVTVEAVVGYGDYDDVPAPLVQAALMLIGHLYENREATFIANSAQAAIVPLGVVDLIEPYRRRVF